MAGALDLNQIASRMIQHGLALLRDRIILDDSLTEFSEIANRTTLIAIARILFLKTPPFWINLAVHNGQVNREYIPSADLEELQWLDPDLDQFLTDIQALLPDTDQNEFKKRFGDAAEIFILAALKKAGANPLHVAKLSDAYGYDIECQGQNFDRIEVKAASGNTQKSFYLSRNEFDKSKLHGKEWRLIQVVFSNRAFIDNKLNSSHVVAIRELRFGILQDLVPPDTLFFRWDKSALITVPADAWCVADISLDPDVVVNGFVQSNSLLLSQ